MALAVAGALAPRGRWPAFDAVRPVLVAFVALGVVLGAGPALRVGDLGPRSRLPTPGCTASSRASPTCATRSASHCSWSWASPRWRPRASPALRPRLGTAGTAALVRAGVPRAPVDSATASSRSPPATAIPAVYAGWRPGRRARGRRSARAADFQDRARGPAHVLLHRALEADGAGLHRLLPARVRFARWRLFHFPAPESVAFLERFGVDTSSSVRRARATRRGGQCEDPVERPFADGHVLRLAARRGRSRAGARPGATSSRSRARVGGAGLVARRRARRSTATRHVVDHGRRRQGTATSSASFSRGPSDRRRISIAVVRSLRVPDAPQAPGEAERGRGGDPSRRGPRLRPRCSPGCCTGPSRRCPGPGHRRRAVSAASGCASRRRTLSRCRGRWPRSAPTPPARPRRPRRLDLLRATAGAPARSRGAPPPALRRVFVRVALDRRCR